VSSEAQTAPATALPTTLPQFVWHYLRVRQGYLWEMFINGMFKCVRMVAPAYVLKKIIDAVGHPHAHAEGSLSRVAYFCIVYVCLEALHVLVTNHYKYICLRMYPQLSSDVQSDMHSYLINHHYAFFEENFSGSLTKKISDMATNLEKLIKILFDFFTATLGLILSSSVLFFVINPKIALILPIWSIAFIYITYLISSRTRRESAETSKAENKVNSAISDSVVNILTIKLFCGVARETQNLQARLLDYVTCKKRLEIAGIKIDLAQGFGVVVLISTMFSVLVSLQGKGLTTVGDFALVASLTTSVSWAVYILGTQIVDISKVAGICTQALSIMVEPNIIVDMPNAAELRVSKGLVEFKNVDFAYDADAYVFKGLNLTINPGQNVGIVGLSGGGKSTLIKILLRLYNLHGGSISIDGQDIKTVTRDSLRKNISTIPQETELFHRTLFENIAFAKPQATAEEVYAAAKIANCDQFINTFAQGYETLSGDRGIKLSGGQRQRIAIARAVLKDAPILLLDEATSALDTLTEKFIQESLDQVMQGKTTIVIAHRLSTLKKMDRIIFFDGGKIVEDGSPEELAEKPNGRFAAVWKLQSEGFITPFKHD
jgi:ATP-binding cassette subfamily B protein